jgi:hypothetical protein
LSIPTSGTLAEYLVDAETYLIKTIAVDETYQGKTFHMERGWLDLKSGQGILYPDRMSYAVQGGKRPLPKSGRSSSILSWAKIGSRFRPSPSDR